MSLKDEIMPLVDAYADAFHACCRPDGGIQFADGLVAKLRKDAIRVALDRLEAELGEEARRMRLARGE